MDRSFNLRLAYVTCVRTCLLFLLNHLESREILSLKLIQLSKYVGDSIGDSGNSDILQRVDSAVCDFEGLVHGDKRRLCLKKRGVILIWVFMCDASGMKGYDTRRSFRAACLMYHPIGIRYQHYRDVAHLLILILTCREATLMSDSRYSWYLF